MSILMMEPFYGGSHKQLVDLLASELKDGCTLVTMPACKWHWRARTSALWLAQNVPPSDSYRVLFASSVVPLAELLGLCPWLQTLHKVVYFHENQLAYPVRNPRVRDFQYGYNQILSCLVADRVVFNSHHNLESFLGAVGPFLRQMPDCRPSPGTLSQCIRAKASVLYFPLNLPAPRALAPEFPDVLHIVWPHRWEHDKGPEEFFEALFQLKAEGLPFRVSVLGEGFADVPEVFSRARAELEEHVVQWGRLDSREAYLGLLARAHVAVSTARHEFFGVAMLEATFLGCFPLCPNRLVYPEIFPRECLYNTTNQLVKKLRNFCGKPSAVRRLKPKVDHERYSWQALRPLYLDLLRAGGTRKDAPNA